jgi:lambda family phage minor tail protein L
MRDTMNTTASWLYLWEIRSSDSEAFYLTDNNESVVFAGTTYFPFPISKPQIERDSEGNITDITVAVSNIDRSISAKLENGGLLGQTVILRIVNSAFLATSTDAYTHRFKIMDATCDDLWATFRLGQTNLFTVQFPSNRFMRTRCRWRYGSTECGYNTARSGALVTCAKTLDDCDDHGDDEVTAGLTRMHPLRFGGFPSIMKGPFA